MEHWRLKLSSYWVHEEDSENLAMPWLCRIHKPEWLDLVLEDVWERDNSTLTSFDSADMLNTGFPVFQTISSSQAFSDFPCGMFFWIWTGLTAWRKARDE
jgi:hypothetical protein